jgi:hypothetical protein
LCGLGQNWPEQITSWARFQIKIGDPWRSWQRGGGGGHSVKRRCGKAGHQVGDKVGDGGNPIWGRKWLNIGSFPQCSAEGSSWWQAGEEAGNVIEVAGENHNTTEELGDAKAAPNGGRRKRSTGMCLAVHGAGENRCGGSCPRSMAAG